MKATKFSLKNLGSDSAISFKETRASFAFYRSVWDNSQQFSNILGSKFLNLSHNFGGKT
jgi:hypothetical protein